MKRTFKIARLSSLALLMIVSACNNTPKNIFLQEWDTPYGTAPFSQITLDQYVPAFKAGIEEQKANIQAIIDCKDAPTFENTVLAMEKASPILDRVEGVFFNVSESDSTPEMQAIEEEVTPLITDASNEIMMNEALFARVKAVYDNMEGLTREQQMATKKLYQSFERNGVGLDEAGKKRFAEISNRLATLTQRRPRQARAGLQGLLLPWQQRQRERHQRHRPGGPETPRRDGPPAGLPELRRLPAVQQDGR